MTSTCANPNCGKEFESRHGATGCSPECRAEINRIRNHGKYHSEVTVREEQPCSICGTAFVPRREQHHYCSKKCGNKASSMRASGSRVPLRPGRSSWAMDYCPWEKGEVEQMPYGDLYQAFAYGEAVSW